MNRKIGFFSALSLWACLLYAEDVRVMQYAYAGPFEIRKPVMVDSLNVNGKPFEMKHLLKSTPSARRTMQQPLYELRITNYGLGSSARRTVQQPLALEADTAGTLLFEGTKSGYALHLLSFYLHSDRYVKGSLEVSGSGTFEVLVDDKPVGNTSELAMEPRRYEVVVRYLTAETDTCPPSLKAAFKSKGEKSGVAASLDPEKRYTLQHIINGLDFREVSLSPDGKYALVKYVNRLPEGKSETYAQLLDAVSGKILLQGKGPVNDARWMPSTAKMYYTRTGEKGTELVAVDPQNMQEELLAENLPKGNFRFSPDETFLLFTVEEEGPKEGAELIRVLEPADRLPGFRNRSFIWRYDLTSGLFEQLTYGHNSTSINDVSADSRYLLFSTGERVYTSRPFSRHSLYKMDLQTLAVDTLWEGAAFISRAAFSPDGKQLLVNGSGDAFNGIGLNIKDEQISNSYDGQLFLYDPATKHAQALTKDFDPAVTGALWNRYDGQIYFTGEDEDRQRIFACNPLNGQIKPLDLPEDVVASYTMARTAPVMYYYGQSVSNANRLYAYDLKKNKNRLVHDLSAGKLKDIVFGEVHDWHFTSADGTEIQGRYYLPPHFDATKKYPLIVYYYGGTSPTNRLLESRYSMHMYAAQGYVVYTLNPSGTTGFGQEFSARHVNAWGKTTAGEIILGTQLFCREHTFVDEKKIGCIGASYGGFMTQYLQTQTNIFAAAVSHAGISALSSYWGEGYWGYGYCSVANADSYPWNNPELYTRQSPLFNADKINTPLLLLHGNADTNVPVGESIQMFAALKLLGKTVEFIQVEGENHGIAGYNKRTGWQNSIFAWFAKWLRDEPAWWESLYPERTL